MEKDSQNSRRLEHDLFGTTPRKKTINSKLKGNANERAVAKFLLAWTGLEFNRVPNSGGLRWKNTEGITGDLVCEDKNFPFSIETKHLKRIPMGKKLRRNSIVYTIWEQAKRDAERSQQYPMLILRENKMPKDKFVIYVNAFISSLIQKFDIEPFSIGHDFDNKVTLVGYSSDDILKINFDKFLSLIKNL